MRLRERVSAQTFEQTRRHLLRAAGARRVCEREAIRLGMCRIAWRTQDYILVSEIFSKQDEILQAEEKKDRLRLRATFPGWGHQTNTRRVLDILRST
jgi:hypothetical protein